MEFTITRTVLLQKIFQHSLKTDIFHASFNVSPFLLAIDMTNIAKK